MKKQTTITIEQSGELQQVTFPVGRISTALKYLKKSMTNFSLISAKTKGI